MIGKKMKFQNLSTMIYGLKTLSMAITCACAFNATTAIADEMNGVTVFDRSDWSWVEPNLVDAIPSQYKPSGQPRYVSLHYTAYRATLAGQDDAALMRNLQHGHINDKNFGDIAYHYIVTINGDAYRGRPVDIAPASGTYYYSDEVLNSVRYQANGELTNESAIIANNNTNGPRPGHTEGHVTVSFNLGYDPSVVFPKSAMENAAKLVAQILVDHDLTPDDVRAHREIGNSHCPGEYIYEWLRGSTMQRDGEGPGMVLIRAKFEELS